MRIAISTGGGDAPGLNAVIRAVVLTAHDRGWSCVGIRRGFHGLYDGTGLVPLGPEEVRGITHLGGTILGTTNRGDPFRWPETLPSPVAKDAPPPAVATVHCYRTLGAVDCFTSQQPQRDSGYTGVYPAQ